MENGLWVKKLLQLLGKDVNTYDHSLRVGKLCKMMATYLHLDEKQTCQLILGGCLHDIGKIFIPDQILKKASALTAQEWKVMQEHPSLGASMIREYGCMDQEIIDVIDFHHERWNGMGYPNGLKGNSTPEFARICGILDSFDSMVTDRPYRKGLTFRQAEEELLLHSGTQFDSYYVDIFLRLSPSFGEIYPFKKHT
ncbi:HD-GYP domain-containing protein [Paenibacillus radicis (ex Xue et al. 2023)]|uniref:HD-GYP domain-containing protein n=1 Tax=Paenibacillus radicis (ex Xue et al. 2023) TaxID=2972489 RepID=A0ABT1YU28_9BACL|nr:HD-GYP domain-containing protein [Paenibacillus radicis (ex Xue et al. 2023)]MCR8636200.1 HD-GYP domain-containing protein [Paenibacillus radicis (ex Xue et al. 2023)]